MMERGRYGRGPHAGQTVAAGGGLGRMGLEGFEKFVDLAFNGLGSGLKLAGVGAGLHRRGTELASGQDLDLARRSATRLLAWGVGGVAGHTADRCLRPYGSGGSAWGGWRLIISPVSRQA